MKTPKELFISYGVVYIFCVLFLILNCYWVAGQQAPIYYSPLIITNSVVQSIHQFSPVQCSQTLTFSIDIGSGKNINWSSTKPPYSLPLLICGIVENNASICENAGASVSVTFIDNKNNNKFTVQSTAHVLPGRICVNIFPCSIWEALKLNGFVSRLEEIQIKVVFAVTGIASARQRLSVTVLGQSILDLRNSTFPEPMRAYQTERHGPSMYVIPAGQCAFSSSPVNNNNTQPNCIPYIGVLPEYEAYYKQFTFFLPPTSLYPVCKSIENVTGVTTLNVFNAMELHLQDTEEALFGLSDIYAKWSYLL